MDSTATGRPCVCILWLSGTSCPVSAPWHSCVAAHWSKYHCYKQAQLWYDLRCLKAKLNPNKQTPSQTKWRSCSYITFFLNVLRLPPPHEKVHPNWNILFQFNSILTLLKVMTIKDETMKIEIWINFFSHTRFLQDLCILRIIRFIYFVRPKLWTASG